jgi:hypothetical protein
MRYRFTAGAALLGALALNLTPAMTPARAGCLAAGRVARAAVRPAFLPASRISEPCGGQNAAPLEAADSTGRHVYVVWEGCHGIGFARSTDGGARFRGPVRLPASRGGFDPAVAVAPNGTVYVVEYQAYSVTDSSRLTLGPAHNYFTASADGGATWSAPVRVGPRWASMAPREWWIDGSIARDSGGYLYVTWDSQRRHDVAWLSFSTNGGAKWSPAVQVSPDRANVPHIAEVAGGFRGTAYVAWLSDNTACGYVLRIRAFSVFSGRLTRPVRSPGRCGRRNVWPGGTFGITALPPANLAAGIWQVALSRGSAVARRHRPPSEILSTLASYPGPG